VIDADRLIRMYLSAGQTSDYIGAAALLSTLPKAGMLLADRGYDADLLRNALILLDIQPCIAIAIDPQGRYSARQNSLQNAPQNREHVRTPEGLAQDRHAL
jgi:hypothetical protein